MNSENPGKQESKETEFSTQAQLEAVDTLALELKRLLKRHDAALEDGTLKHHITTLEHWMKSYREGLDAARKISSVGSDWLTEVHDKLKLAVDEMYRLEGEGGAPTSPEQAQKAEIMLKTVQRIEKVMPNIQHLFPGASEVEKEQK